MLSSDVIERLISYAGADTDGDAALATARRSMQDALREFPGLHRWTYLYSHERLLLNEPYSEGTIAYDSSTRQLTLTGGTWPSWAAYGDVRIADIVSSVAERTSATVLTLSSTIHPIDDIDAGTAYTLYQDTYTLPENFVSSDASIAEGRFGSLAYVIPSALMWATRTAERSGPPLYYTFVPDRFTAGRLALRVTPYPDADQTLDSVYQRKMRAIRYDSQTPVASEGRASITSGSTTVTGTGTAWRSNMVGSVIRFSDTAAAPTGTDGKNQAVFETTITGFTSSTSITVADQATETLSGVAYAIADPLDIEDGAMASAFCWQAIRHFAAHLRMKDRDTIEREAMMSLTLAKEQDARSFATSRAGPGRMRRPLLKDMPTGDDDV